MTFSTIVPENVAAGFGVFQHDTASGVWNLANWYPILAGWEPGTGWYLQEPTQFGDPTFAETATYDVSVSLPDDLALVSTGETTNTQLGMLGFRDVFITTGPAREFAMTLLPGDVATSEARAGNVTVRVSLPASGTVPGLAEFMADTAADALDTYEDWLGEYPSSELDLSVAQLSGASGVSWSGLTWFGLDPITRDGEFSDDERTSLAFVILHEVGHQWFADVVGSNNNDHGFMTEGLVQALAVLGAAELYGDERAELYLQAWVAGPYSSLLNDERDGIADAPLTDDTNGVIRSLLVYGKAGVGFIAIHNEIGEEAFLDGLALYASEYRFALSTPEDLQSALEDACRCDIDATWTFWFEQDDATRADLDAVIAEFGERETAAS
jgi:aminopeptidase N